MQSISFNPAMLAAVRAGRKTVTRRRLPPNSALQQEPDRYRFVGLSAQGALFEDQQGTPPTRLPPLPLPFGAAGHLLSVQEAPSLVLQIVSVRAEPVRSLTEADAVAEGIRARPESGPPQWGGVEPRATQLNAFYWYGSPIAAFRSLLDSIYPTAWVRNELVWVIDMLQRYISYFGSLDHLQKPSGSWKRTGI